MADAKEVSAEAAKALLDAVLKQSELLGSWSLAAFGAAILIVVWYVQRKLDQKPTPLTWKWLVVFSLACQSLSILAMYFAYGMVVIVIPELQFAKLDTSQIFYDYLEHLHEFSHAQLLLSAQFWLFFVGIISLAFFGVLNYPLINPKK
jgi:predicted MFS family arabinose efflux permease